MAIMMAFLSNAGTSSITAVSTTVDAFRVGSSASAAVRFNTSGSQQSIKNGSVTGLGNWVNPATTADEWEIRTILDSGDTPDVGSLGVWFDFSIDRVWSLIADVGQTKSASLTFQFRRVGDTDPAFSVSGTSLTARSEDFF